MDKKEMFAFITANPYCCFGTVEDSKPHIRHLLTFRADENGIIFSTNITRDVYRQVIGNPEVEACYFDDDTQLRVSGPAELLKDEALKKEIVDARPFLQPYIEKNGWDFMVIIRLKPVKASTWTRQNPMGGKTEIEL